MTTLRSYDLNGKKLSFANWISNLSPQETPFTSMTGKESIDQTLFQWQVDCLEIAKSNAIKEGSPAVESNMSSTQVKSNITQILRKTVKVSDTANALANYGRGKEIQYQMEKAGQEIKRDLEYAFLNNTLAVEGSATVARETAGFRGLVAPVDAIESDTYAVVHSHSAAPNVFTEKDIFKITYNLYLSGSDANIIMYHPKHATVFSALQEATGANGQRKRIFESTPKFSVYVSTIVDPLGQSYSLVPNRWMPEDAVYFFNASDWTQMVLRAPARTKLAKDGNYEKWMVEMEVGLRHKHPFASGILELSDPTKKLTTTNVNPAAFISDTNKGDALSGSLMVAQVGKSLKLSLKGVGSEALTIPAGSLKVRKNGKVIWTSTAEFVAGTAAPAPAPTPPRTGGAPVPELRANTDWSAGETLVSALTLDDAGFYQLSVTTGGVEELYPACSVTVYNGNIVVDPLSVEV